MASFAGAASSAAPDEKNAYRKDCVAPVKDTRVQTEVSSFYQTQHILIKKEFDSLLTCLLFLLIFSTPHFFCCHLYHINRM